MEFDSTLYGDTLARVTEIAASKAARFDSMEDCRVVYYQKFVGKDGMLDFVKINAYLWRRRRAMQK